MAVLVKYEAACIALAEAHRVDEVKDIHDKAEAMRVYAVQAKNVDLECMAADVRLRAERRLGELLAAEKGAGRFGRGRRKSVSGTDLNGVVTLGDLGVDENLSRRSQKVAGIAEAAFESMVAGVRQQIIDRARKPAVSGVDKKARRRNREKILGGIQCALPNKKFGVIYADPEWRFEVYSRDTGMDRAADNHYPTSATDEICQRPVRDIAADDCVLFLWATVPMLPDALKVMAAWGFAYKSHCAWTKDKVGTGYWFRNSHELLLVGTRGNVPAPAPGTQWPSTIEGRVTKHSAKPERFYELIEEYFPTLPKIELNARAAREGWDGWGNEYRGNEAPTDAAGTNLPHDPETGEINESDSVPVASVSRVNAPAHDDTGRDDAPA